MTTRTLQFYGQGWGAETAEITAVLNGQTVYSGPIPTQSTTPPPGFTPVLLFTVDNFIDVDVAGSFPMTVIPTKGNVAMADVKVNYTYAPNPVYTPEQFAILNDITIPDADKLSIVEAAANPPFTQDEIAVLTAPGTSASEATSLLTAHNAYGYVVNADVFNDQPGDVRSDVTIDGIPQITPEPRPSGEDGDWHWSVYTNQILECNINIASGFSIPS